MRKKIPEFITLSKKYLWFGTTVLTDQRDNKHKHMNNSVALPNLISVGSMLIRNSREAPRLKLFGLERRMHCWRSPKKISFSIKNPSN